MERNPPQLEYPKKNSIDPTILNFTQEIARLELYSFIRAFYVQSEIRFLYLMYINGQKVILQANNIV